MRRRLATTFQSLTVRNYRLFATGQLIKLIGVWTQFIAQDWLVLQLSDNSPTALGFVTGLQFLPVLLLTLYGGRLADRYDKRRLLIVVNVAFAVSAVIVGVLVATGSVRLWYVFAFAAVTGVINSVETPVRQAFFSELVPRELLPNALSLGGATFNGARVIGPAIAGLAIGWFGIGPVFVVDGLVCTAPVLALLRMDPTRLYRGEGRPAARDARVVDGLRYVRRRPDLLQPIMIMLLVGMFGFNFQLTLAVLAKNVFHARAGTFGLLTTALAFGALFGALAGTARRARPSAYLVFTTAVVFGALETLVGFAPGFVSAAALLVPTGFFMIFLAQAANQRVQMGTDAEYRGRVMALYVLVFLGTTPIGAPLVGWSAEMFGPRFGIVLGGLISLVTALTVAIVHVRTVGAKVHLHLRPRPHVHVRQPPRGDAPAVELRVPRGRAPGGVEDVMAVSARAA